MTDLLLMIIFGAFIVANTVLLSLIYLLLHNALHTRTMRESVRRLWVKVPHEELGQ